MGFLTLFAGIIQRENSMKLFYQSPKFDIGKIYKEVQKGYGIEKPERVMGYAGTFLFTLGDVYTSDMLNRFMLKDVTLADYLSVIMNRFMKDDFGEVSKDIESNNLENRYIGGGSYMIGRYNSFYGFIKLKTLPGYTLLSFDAENPETE